MRTAAAALSLRPWQLDLMRMTPPQSWTEVEEHLHGMFVLLFKAWDERVRLPLPGEEESDLVAKTCDAALVHFVRGADRNLYGPETARPWMLARIYTAMQMAKAASQTDHPIPPMPLADILALMLTFQWHDWLHDMWMNEVAKDVAPKN